MWTGLLGIVASNGALAQAPPEAPASDAPEVLVVDVETERTDEGVVRLDSEAIAARPVRSPMELARALPGLHLSAHGGRGKAWQFFYRGFDAQHGSDLAVSVMGVPLNEPSNVHAHGYVDAELLGSRWVTALTLVPAVDRAHVGAFGVAAAMDFDLGLSEEGGFVRIVGGSDRGGALQVGWRPERGAAGTFVAAEVDAGAGVTDARGWRMGRVAGGWEGDVGSARLRALVLGYTGRFRSPGALRVDDVEAGRVGFYEGYSALSGGASDQALATVRARWREGAGGGSLQGWAVARALTLTQDFTGFAQHPDTGDASEQVQRSVRSGLRGLGWLRVRLSHRVGMSFDWGGELRADSHRQWIDQVDVAGEAWSRASDGRLLEVGGEAFFETGVEVGGWLRGQVGLRAAGWWQRVGAAGRVGHGRRPRSPRARRGGSGRRAPAVGRLRPRVPTATLGGRRPRRGRACRLGARRCRLRLGPG